MGRTTYPTLPVSHAKPKTCWRHAFKLTALVLKARRQSKSLSGHFLKPVKFLKRRSRFPKTVEEHLQPEKPMLLQTGKTTSQATL